MSAAAEQFREWDERNRAEQRASWEHKVTMERKRQIAKGYTAEHDREHGVAHLLLWAQEYAYKNEPIKSAALIQAAMELL